VYLFHHCFISIRFDIFFTKKTAAMLSLTIVSTSKSFGILISSTMTVFSVLETTYFRAMYRLVDLFKKWQPNHSRAMARDVKDSKFIIKRKIELNIRKIVASYFFDLKKMPNFYIAVRSNSLSRIFMNFVFKNKNLQFSSLR